MVMMKVDDQTARRALGMADGNLSFAVQMLVNGVVHRTVENAPPPPPDSPPAAARAVPQGAHVVDHEAKAGQPRAHPRGQRVVRAAPANAKGEIVGKAKGPAAWV